MQEIELPCGGCNNLLRVKAEYAGKQARCPQCKHINSIPLNNEATVASPAVAQSVPPKAASPFAASNPYSSPPHSKSSAPLGRESRSDIIETFRPLFESVFYMKFFAWYLIAIGVIYALSIYGLIVAWLPIWVGICLRNAAIRLQEGYPSGNPHTLYEATKNLATIAKIAGIVAMIGVGFLVLFLCFALVALFVGVGFAAQG